jgi:hypothetical protein
MNSQVIPVLSDLSSLVTKEISDAIETALLDQILLNFENVAIT